MSTTELQSCEDALRLLAAHLDRELEPSDTERMERHLEICRTCYSRADFERRLKRHVAELRKEPVRQELADRVSSLIRTFEVRPGE